MTARGTTANARTADTDRCAPIAQFSSDCISSEPVSSPMIFCIASAVMFSSADAAHLHGGTRHTKSKARARHRTRRMLTSAQLPATSVYEQSSQLSPFVTTGQLGRAQDASQACRSVASGAKQGRENLHALSSLDACLHVAVTLDMLQLIRPASWLRNPGKHGAKFRTTRSTSETGLWTRAMGAAARLIARRHPTSTSGACTVSRGRAQRT